MAHKISEIKDLDPQVQAKLEEAGIKTTDDLLREAGAGPQRTALAHKLGIAGPQLTELINRADLMRLKGVGKEMANLLEECGVDSCKELQHRKAETLAAKLKETNDQKKITHHAPTLAQVQEWIHEAATFSAQQ
jgi:predicted flap endonuclease-1-like 5' DNA nuclease